MIIEDDKHYNEMAEYPDWDLDGLAKHKSYNTFERYALVPKSLYENEGWKENGGVIENVKDDEDWILVQAVLIPDEKDIKNRGKFTSGKIVWMEMVDEDSWPLDECHTERIDGRWLGRGEIEKQLENQIARNLTANLRRRGLLWATKKIYQSSDEEVQSQLLMEVKDGEVVYVKPNGTITQINTQSQQLNEFSSDEASWKENSQQNAFAFNIATGENMPSGTSFSLGVVLDKAVSSHFTAVRNRFSNYLKRDFFNQLIEVFKEEYAEEHERPINMSSDDIEAFRDSVIIFHANERYFDALAKRKNPRMEQIRAQVEEELMKSPYVFLTIPDDFYENAIFYMKLNIDDDIGPDIQTLTTIYTTMEQKGDPRSEVVLRQILSKQGKSLTAIAGKKPAPVAPIAPNGPQGGPGQSVPSPMNPGAPAAEVTQ